MKKYKLLLSLIFLTGTYISNATHFAGAEIFYEHISGTARDYKVTVIVYGDLNGAAALPTQIPISYSLRALRPK